ncbi:MAG: PEP-CTERM sorting domain-containing protein [Acidobacteriaceae bacterium]|nr:PEP-CTERM sorting domain-containing protein [Acidobacteriaceae bacterium]
MGRFFGELDKQSLLKAIKECRRACIAAEAELAPVIWRLAKQTISDKIQARWEIFPKMRFPRSVLALLLASTPLTLQASKPTIIVNGDPPDITIITNTSFEYYADSRGGGDFSFQNETGQSWAQLDVLVTLPSTVTAITCESLAFVTCTATPPNAMMTQWDITFGPNPKGGIPNGATFSINLNNNGIVNMQPDGVGDWGPRTEFDDIANKDLPEPASWALMGIGALCLAAISVKRSALSLRRAHISNLLRSCAEFDRTLVITIDRSFTSSRC